MTSPASTTSKPKTAPPSAYAPLVRSYRWITAIGGVLWLGCVAGVLLSSGPVAWGSYATPFVLGGALLWLGRWGLRIGAVVPVLATSYNLVQAGKLVEASARLDTLASNRSRSIRSAVSFQRALIAVRRGDLAEAARRLDEMLAMPPRWIEGVSGEVQRGAAHGIRAWVRAAMGDALGAEADVAVVRAARTPNAAALAHASLAEALIAERAGDRGKLAALLRRDHRLLLGSLDMRERAVIRAMERMLKAPKASVYRTAIEPKKLAAEDEPPVVEWVGRVTPELAPFLPRPRAEARAGGAPPLHFEPSPEAVARVQRTHAKKPLVGIGARVLALWVVLVGLFVGVWQFLEPDRRHTGGHGAAAPHDDTTLLLALGGLAVALVAAAVARVWLVVRRVRANTRELHRLNTAVACGEDVEKDLTELARAKQEVIAAQAELLLAVVSDRRGDLAGALAHIDAARAKIRTRPGRAAAAGHVTPSLTASRAYQLAALGRADEAAAELSQLPPDYLLLDRMRFVVPLVALLARGDVDGAGRLVAATSPDLSVGPRDELLRDLVHASTSPAGRGAAEIARLRDELRDREESRRWIEKVAPALLARFEHATVGRDDESAAESEAEAEEEAQAEAEAALARA
jgi:hypothetical protein